MRAITSILLILISSYVSAAQTKENYSDAPAVEIPEKSEFISSLKVHDINKIISGFYRIKIPTKSEYEKKSDFIKYISNYEKNKVLYGSIHPGDVVEIPFNIGYFEKYDSEKESLKLAIQGSYMLMSGVDDETVNGTDFSVKTNTKNKKPYMARNGFGVRVRVEQSTSDQTSILVKGELIQSFKRDIELNIDGITALLCKATCKAMIVGKMSYPYVAFGHEIHPPKIDEPYMHTSTRKSLVLENGSEIFIYLPTSGKILYRSKIN